jgi:D-inositol-3-phosphate glycosyltransferase
MPIWAISIGTRTSLTLVPTQEAFGNVFAEAVATGLPIVGSDVGGVRDMVEPGENGILIHPGNPNKLAGVIAHLAENPDERLRMGRRSAERARDLLTWSDIPRLYLDVYERVLTRRQECSARRRVQ